MNENKIKLIGAGIGALAGFGLVSIGLSSKRRKKIPLSKTVPVINKQRSVVNNKELSRKEAEEILHKWLYSAAKTIRLYSSHEYEIMLSNKLDEMLNNKKVQFDDVRKLYETKSHLGYGDDVLAFFDPFLDTVTNQPRNIIVIDISNSIKYGYWEFVDTVAHEAWHAVQQEFGLIKVDSNNKATFIPNLNRLEEDARQMASGLLAKCKKAA